MLITAGTSHKYSPIHIREKFYFTKKAAAEALAGLIKFDVISAAVIISTCNRAEFYADVSDIDDGVEVLKKFLPFYDYVYTGRDAARHLFCVACGLDSQIIGETQILEQIEASLERARQQKTVNKYLDFIFNKARQAASKVRAGTSLYSGEISIAGIAADFLKSRRDNIKGKNILIIGAGRVSELLAGYLKEEGARIAFVSNKTYEKAKALADSVNGEAITLGALKYRLREADIMISATSSPHIVLKKEELPVMPQRLLILDLAVPRDIDDAVRGIDGVELYNLDDLSFFIEYKTKDRRQEIPKALSIIEEEVDKLCLTKNSESRPEPALSL